MILVFKTNVTSKSKALRTAKALERLLPQVRWNFDLEDCDNILRIDSETDVSKFLAAEIRKFGVLIEELPD